MPPKIYYALMTVIIDKRISDFISISFPVGFGFGFGIRFRSRVMEF
jgi:hypothetical protein